MATPNEAASRKRKAASMLDQPVSHAASLPYNVDSDETKPKAITLQPEWKAFQDGKRYIYTLICEPYHRYNDVANVPLKIIEELRVAVEDSKKEDILVAISGAMGSGKSSTLNALFSVGEIAPKGASGSCTLVPTEYTMMQPTQQLPFHGVAHILSRPERRVLLASELAAYFNALNREDDGAEESAPSNKTAEPDDLDVLDNVSENIYTTFCDQPECCTKVAARNFLGSATSEHDPKIIGKMTSWLDHRIDKVAGGADTVTCEASTPEDLNKRLGIFTTKPDDDDSEPVPTLWLFTSLVRVHFDSMLTGLGVKFIDLPGSSDSNKHRQQNSTSHRRRCTHLAHVANSVRAINDGGITSALKNALNCGEGRLIVILPFSDTIDEKDMVNRGSPREQAETVQLKNVVTHLEKEFAALTMQETATDPDDTGYVRIRKAHRDSELRLRLAQNAEKASRIQIRSRMSSKSIQSKLRDALHFASDVPIFSISNECYKQHQKGFPARLTPTLSPEESNVPSLRRWLAETPNAARIREMRFELTSRIPGLLNRLELNLNTSPIKGKEDIEEHVKKPLHKCAHALARHFEDFSNDIEQKIFAVLMFEQADWIRQAKRLVANWSAEETNAKFLALMKRSGVRQGRGSRTTGVNMTEDLENIKSEYTQQVFSKVESEHRQLRMDLRGSLEHLRSKMLKDICEDPLADCVTLEPFFDYLGTERQKLDQAVDVAMGTLFQKLSIIYERLSSTEPDAYLVRAMQPIYEDVSRIKCGKPVGGGPAPKKPQLGYPKERLRVFKERVTKVNGVWAWTCELAKKEFLAVSEQCRKEVVDAARGIFADIHTAFLELCEAKVIEGDREMMLRAEVKVNLDKARQYLAGPMAAAVKGLEADFR